MTCFKEGCTTLVVYKQRGFDQTKTRIKILKTSKEPQPLCKSETLSELSDTTTASYIRG